MGNCLISVHVTGAHHNNKATDIDQLAADFVGELKKHGHNVTASSLVTGREYDLLNSAARFPVHAHKPT